MRDGGHDGDARIVALPEEIVAAIQLIDCYLGNEELRAVRVRAGVGHGHAAGLVEEKRRRGLLVEVEAAVAHAGAGGIAALRHEAGDHAMEGRAVVQRLVVHLALRG